MNTVQRAFENEMIFVSSFSSDLRETKNHEFWNVKFKLFFQMQIMKIIEQSAKLAYGHLQHVGLIQLDGDKHYFVDQEEEYITWNPIGKALLQLPEASPEELFIGYHAIEYYVDLYCNKTESHYYTHFQNNPFHLLGNYSLEDIFRKSPFYKSTPLIQRRWLESFDFREWKHSIIFDQDRFAPSTFMTAVRKWYAPCQYYFEKKNLMQLLKQEFVQFLQKEKKYAIQYAEILNDNEIENNLYQMFLKKKLPISRQTLLRIHRQESYAFTTREIWSMENCIFLNKGERIEQTDELSPFYPHRFTMHGLHFKSVHHYVWFRIFKIFSKNISRSFQYSKAPNNHSTLKGILEKVEDRALFRCCQENMNKFNFQLFLLENNVFSERKMIQQSQNTIESWSVNGAWKYEKLRFLNDWQTFCNWRTKCSFKDFQNFIKLFYPRLIDDETPANAERREFNISMDPEIERSITNMFSHAVQNDFYLVSTFPEHFLSWLVSMTKPIRAACLETNFISMMKEVMYRHEFSSHEQTFSLKVLQRTFSMAECLIIEQLF